jgi:2-polyprenyl-3-methyl-5-hydroxy-6-metoxy-1,4-benzoquinol methylase
MYCIVCNNRDYDVLLNLKCGGFDNSPLYDTVTVISCRNCGHVYNLLNKQDIKGLDEYYKEEYSKCNIDSPNKKGDIPGNNSPDSLKRYSDLYEMIKDEIKPESNILDVGCAMGGFLESIKPYCDNRYGIELSDKFIDVAKEKNNNILKGSAECIPFQDKSFDIIVADQVLEHLVNPNVFFMEANRTLKEDGILCISVPSANHYQTNSFFDFYFFLMREHIHHFGASQLRLIANEHGFNMIDSKVTYPNLISNVGKLPNLTMKFIKGTKSRSLFMELKDRAMSLTYQTRCYINDSYRHLIKRREDINKIDISKPLYIYGTSREFQYLYNNTNLKNLNIILVDDTIAKQNMTIHGKAVSNSHILKNATENILITAFAHINTLREKLKELNFKGEIY